MHEQDLNEHDRLIRQLCHNNVTGLIYVVGKWKDAERKCADLELENQKLKNQLANAGISDTNDLKTKWYRKFWKS